MQFGYKHEQKENFKNILINKYVNMTQHYQIIQLDVQMINAQLIQEMNHEK